MKHKLYTASGSALPSTEKFSMRACQHEWGANIKLAQLVAGHSIFWYWKDTGHSRKGRIAVSFCIMWSKSLTVLV
jgi:hypothetical protein